ncbi:8812a890-e91e-44ca-bc1f-0b628218c006 [Sclerotinia trifoliorum]|uniref:8812a890-e91e-44ca-bc1f-0b628218c006 n=1 Tax=Sclerotinia trifoliorum TaxID=28548 RepID=A0A8H2VZE7_9HELO|nr:8812a890-e91e-44ca-bc1f-0b628218c006 [Sclerotinia trifoliorum]
MNEAKVNEDGTWVSIRGGAKWGSLSVWIENWRYEILILIIVHFRRRREPRRHLFFQRNIRLRCDNVINYEIVLADGKIVNANQSDNHYFLGLQ